MTKERIRLLIAAANTERLRYYERQEARAREFRKLHGYNADESDEGEELDDVIINGADYEAAKQRITEMQQTKRAIRS